MSVKSGFTREHTIASIWVLGLACGAPLLAAVVMGGLFMAGAPGFKPVQQSSPVGATVASVPNIHVTIATGLGPHHNWPAFEPNDLSIPANRSVTITVTDLDGATPLTSSLRIYSKVKGVIGDHMAVVPIRLAQPKIAVGRARELARVNLSEVSHTFTIPSLGVNVPLLGGTRTSFTIRVPKPGTYTWECVDPCGSGPGGFGVPMSLVGYMVGTLTATAA